MASYTYFVLQNGTYKPVPSFDSDYIPTSDQKDALAGTSGSPGSANAYVTNDDSRMTDARTPTSHDNTYHSETYITSAGVTYENLDTNGDVGQVASTVAAGDDGRFPTSDEKDALAGEGTPSASNKYTTKSYVDGLVQGLDWQESVDYDINYVKTDAGAPSGTATDGERCLNTNEDKLYTYSSGWDAGVSCSTGDRHVFKTSGDDTSGDSGTYTKDDKIYEYNGATFDETAASEGMAFWSEEEDKLFVYNGTNYVQFGSTSDHNSLSGLQGGNGSTEYYHITSDQEAGLDAATAITASNPPLTSSDRDRLPTRISFVYRGGFAVSQTDVEFFSAGGAFQQVLMPSAGSMVKTTLQSSAARTAGTLTAEPTINGTKVTANDLDLTLDGSTTNDDKAEVAPGTTNLTFTAGQKVGVKVTSDEDWAPTTSDLEFCLYVIFDT